MVIVVLVIGLALLGFGLSQKLKGNRILAAPFHKTGEIAKNASVTDAKGMVSTEGAIVAPEPLLSPCSQTPCLYYEVEIARTWEKQEQTQNGTETKKGSSKVSTLKEGALFSLDDGSGPIGISLKDGADVEMKKGFDDRVKVEMRVPGELVFGQLHLQTPKLPSGERTTGFTAVEKFVPAEGKFFALAKLDQGQLVKPGWRSMVLSGKGREGLLAHTSKLSKVGFIGGGVAAVLSIPLFLFGPKPEPKTTPDCTVALSDTQVKCDDSVSTASGRTYTWTVSKAGTYTLAVDPPKVKFPLDPAITVTDSDGKEVANAEGDARGSRTELTHSLTPGTYSVVVKDDLGKTVKGGFSYQLEVTAATVAETPPETPHVDAVKAVGAPVVAPATGKKVAKKPAGKHQGLRPATNH